MRKTLRPQPADAIHSCAYLQLWVDELLLAPAKMLAAVAHSEVVRDRDQRMPRSKRPHLLSIINQGLVDRAQDGKVSLNADVAFSLGLITARAARLRRPAPHDASTPT